MDPLLFSDAHKSAVRHARHSGVQFGLGFSFLVPFQPRNLLSRGLSSSCTTTAKTISMKSPDVGQISLYSGVGVLASVLTNRLIFTPIDSIAMAQSRSDILGVIAGATLLLYGVGKAEIAARQRETVKLNGIDIRKGFNNIANEEVAYELEWASDAMVSAVPNIKSCAIFAADVGWTFLGQFRDQNLVAEISPGGVLDLAMKKGERAYLADMKTVPVKDVQFGFFPNNCQAVVAQPISERAVIVLGADKPRPFTGSDFGWVQAIADRLSVVLGKSLHGE